MMDDGVAEHHFSRIITLESRAIFGPKFAYFLLFYHCPASGMRNGDEALLSIIVAIRGLIVKMLIVLEPNLIF